MSDYVEVGRRKTKGDKKLRCGIRFTRKAGSIGAKMLTRGRVKRNN